MILYNILNRFYTDFPNTDFLGSQLGNNPSYIWKGIHAAKDLVGAGTRWKVGDGSAIRI